MSEQVPTQGKYWVRWTLAILGGILGAWLVDASSAEFAILVLLYRLLMEIE